MYYQLHYFLLINKLFYRNWYSYEKISSDETPQTNIELLLINHIVRF